MGLMDMLKTSDPMAKFYAAAEKSNVPQGGITGKLFSAMFPHGLGNLAFGRNPEPMPPLETPEGTALMADLASNMMVPGTFIGPKGLARLFGDDAAKGMLATAESKLAQGVPKEAVFQELGVFKGPEGKWRYEIDDSTRSVNEYPFSPREAYDNARETAFINDEGWDAVERMKPYADKTTAAIDAEWKKGGEDIVNAVRAGDKPLAHKLMNERGGIESIFTEMRDRKFGPMSAYMGHDDLYSAYTDMGDMHMRVDKDLDSGGVYLRAEPNMRGEHIAVRDFPRKDKGSTTLHELQHAVQEREGFAAGGSPSQWEQIANDRLIDLLGKDPRLESTYSKYAALDRAIGMGEDFDPMAYEILESALLSHPRGQEVSTLHGVLSGDGRAAGSPVAHDLYQRLAGEAEARAVQDRMNMSMDERRALFPEYAGRNDLIVRGLMSGGE